MQPQSGSPRREIILSNNHNRSGRSTNLYAVWKAFTVCFVSVWGARPISRTSCPSDVRSKDASNDETSETFRCIAIPPAQGMG
jgi:hypothetical protein